MSSQFDRLENRLQAFIENSLSRLPWHKDQPRLAAPLISEIRAQLELDNRSTEPLPDCFNLFMSPDNCTAWEQHPEWVDWLKRVLLDMTVESGRSFSREPEIRFLSEDGMESKNLRLVLTYQEGKVSSTAVLTADADPLEPPQNDAWNGPYLILENSKTYPLINPVTNIGRREDNDLIVSDPRVSRNHAQIRIIHGECVLFDLNSTGGTFVNGHRINTHSLRPGDVIAVAGVSLIFGQDTPAAPRSTGTSPAQLNP